jgi:hypothetical protein
LARGAIREGQIGTLLAPTVALALQHHERTGAELHASPRHAIPGRGECKKTEDVAFAHSLGLTAATVCMGCPFRVGCTARDTVGDREKGVIATHEHVGKFPDEVIFIDEMPNTTLHVSRLPKSGLVDALARVTLASASEWLAIAQAWAREIEAGTFGEEARWKASRLESPPIKHQDVQYVEMLERWNAPVPERAARRAAEERRRAAWKARATQKQNDESAARTAARRAEHANAPERTYRADVAIAVGVWKSAREDAKFFDKGDHWEVARLANVLYALQTRGGLLLASGAPAAVLGALRPQGEAGRGTQLEGRPAVEIRRVDRVTDGRPVRRVMIKTANMTTRKLKTQRGVVLLGRVLADIRHRAQAFGAKTEEIAIFTAKVFASMVAKAAPGCQVGTFGALRGKDAWMQCKVFAVIGDHFEDKDSNALEATYFGIDDRELWAEKVACEKEQAFGRAREPQPGEPALMLCYGHVLPNRWAGACEDEQWQDVAPAPVPSRLDVAELQRLKGDGKTQRAIAATLGVSVITVKRAWRTSGGIE